MVNLQWAHVGCDFCLIDYGDAYSDVDCANWVEPDWKHWVADEWPTNADVDMIFYIKKKSIQIKLN